MDKIMTWKEIKKQTEDLYKSIITPLLPDYVKLVKKFTISPKVPKVPAGEYNHTKNGIFNGNNGTLTIHPYNMGVDDGVEKDYKKWKINFSYILFCIAHELRHAYQIMELKAVDKVKINASSDETIKLGYSCLRDILEMDADLFSASFLISNLDTIKNKYPDFSVNWLILHIMMFDKTKDTNFLLNTETENNNIITNIDRWKIIMLKTFNDKLFKQNEYTKFIDELKITTLDNPLVFTITGVKSMN